MKNITTIFFVLTMGVINIMASFPGDSMSLAILWNEQYTKQKNIEKLANIDQIGFLLRESSPDIANAMLIAIEDEEIKGKLSADTNDKLRNEVLFEYLHSKYFYDKKKSTSQGAWNKIKSFFSSGDKDKDTNNNKEPKGFVVIMPPYVANNIDRFSKDTKVGVSYLSHILDERDFELIYDAKSKKEREKIIKELIKDYYIDDKVDHTKPGILRQIFMIPIF